MYNKFENIFNSPLKLWAVRFERTSLNMWHVWKLSSIPYLLFSFVFLVFLFLVHCGREQNAIKNHCYGDVLLEAKRVAMFLLSIHFGGRVRRRSKALHFDQLLSLRLPLSAISWQPFVQHGFNKCNNRMSFKQIWSFFKHKIISSVLVCASFSKIRKVNNKIKQNKELLVKK